MDELLRDILIGSITLLFGGYLLILLYRALKAGRPGLAIGLPLTIAFVVRIVAAAGVTLTPFERFMRGGDELAFTFKAQLATETPFGSELWINALTGELPTFLFAVQKAVLGSPDFALRITMITLAVAGLLLMATAVHELAGPRAATIAMWFLALEPANIFFSSILHKEPTMMLAGGLVALAGAKLWKRLDPRYLLLIVLGCLIAVATRPYAGWFLIAAGAAITLHAAHRTTRRSLFRGFTVLAVIVFVGAVGAPIVLEASTDENLSELQVTQDATVELEGNLNLERVDFSTREAVLINLPERVVDVLTRPYLWQIENVSQQFAVLGTLVALTIVFLLGRELLANRKGMMEHAGPLLYVSFALLVAYSLSAANAGTAFRYRTHIVAVAGCAAIALIVSRRQSEQQASREPPSTQQRTRMSEPVEV